MQLFHSWQIDNRLETVNREIDFSHLYTSTPLNLYL